MSTLHKLKWTMSGTNSDDDVDSPVIREFHASLEPFAFTARPNANIPRNDTDIQGIERKRRLPSDERGTTLDKKPSTSISPLPRKKKKRGYAAPETYAHLGVLQDVLTEGLDGTLSVYIIIHNPSRWFHKFAISRVLRYQVSLKPFAYCMLFKFMSLPQPRSKVRPNRTPFWPSNKSLLELPS